MTGCRIGRVTLKGGAQLLRLPVKEHGEVQSKLCDASATIADYFAPDEMAGYVLVGWAFDGAYSTAYMIHAESIVGPGLLPSFVADALRRDMIECGQWGS